MRLHVGSGWPRPFALSWRSVHAESVSRVAHALWHRCESKRIIGLASESAFWVSLALLPLAAVSGMVAARLALSDQVAVGMLSRSFPPDARALVARELAQVASYDGGRLGPVATLVFVWLASSGIHAVLDAFEALAGARERAWWKKRAISIGCCFALGIGIGAIAIIGLPLVQIASPEDGAAPGVSLFSAALQLAVGVASELLFTMGLYWVGLPRAARPRVLFPGVFAAVALQIVLGACYVVFIGALGDGSAYLAGLAAVGVTMTAVFIYMLSLLFGLALNLVLAARKRVRAAVHAE